MKPWVIILTSFLYLGLLFGIAFWVERRSRQGKSLVNNSVVYALSLAVYCTAWTFYGSVGRAATQGLSFLPIYLGPTIIAPIWMIVLRKIIIISKHQRTTSIADFISSRYGKSISLGVIATLIAVFGVIPYISIQLKAISSSFFILIHHKNPGAIPQEVPFYMDSAFYIAIILAVFTILFGTRKLDPNERHEGMVAAIAFESLLKIVAFLAVGIFITFNVFDGFGDIFKQSLQNIDTTHLFSFDAMRMEGPQWFWLTFLSMIAIMLLPRQFHVSVVENTDPNHLRKASWLFPLYLLLINIFVIPIALGGLLHFPNKAVEPDTFVLSLPLSYGHETLALFVALGGFSAATSMVIVAVIALSIMISNHLITPFLLQPDWFRKNKRSDTNLSLPLLNMRRLSIAVVLLLAYGYFRTVGQAYTLVSIGLISFTAIAQFAPVILGAIYWKGASKAGAKAGLIVGFSLWAFTLPFPTLIEAGMLPRSILEEGLLGLGVLRPYALFGMEESNHVAHAAFWSLLLNSLTFLIVSVYSRQSQEEISQAALFVDIYKYSTGDTQHQIMRRRAKVLDIRLLLNRFLGEDRSKEIFRFYEKKSGLKLHDSQLGRSDFINLAEIQLAGSIGAASAKVIMSTVTKEDPISLEEMFKILEQTQEIIQYSKALERKSKELEDTTTQLREANERLKELDGLKADFITTVTHELRTPITSIKALSRIMLDNQTSLSPEKQKEFLGVLVSESERISRLINQVLDLEKIENVKVDTFQLLNFSDLVRNAFHGLEQLMASGSIQSELHISNPNIGVLGHQDRLTQVVVNLISNAIKFCDTEHGFIKVQVEDHPQEVRLFVTDNGRGIPLKNQQLIFEKFTQLSDKKAGKPKGSGLGLYITKSIIENHKGSISVSSTVGQGATFEVRLPKYLLPVDALAG